LKFASRQIQCDAENRLFRYISTELPALRTTLKKRNQIHCRYLAGLAELGLGRTEEAVADLREVLALDINHLSAQTELENLAPRKLWGHNHDHLLSGESTPRTTAAIERPDSALQQRLFVDNLSGGGARRFASSAMTGW